ncbi:MAG: 1-deoxy-D-xylulose-5-phosphate reductoisomerase [Thermodesulfobacteriota bacterium]
MKSRRHIAVLGSTGSIGRNCLDVAARFPDRFQVVGLTAGRNVRLLADQAAAFRPRLLAVQGPEEARELERLLGSNRQAEIAWGEEGLIRVAAMAEAETVVSAVVGATGLKPTWTAVLAGKRVALANKETLVMAGELVMNEARASGAEILPVDSEHSAIFQVLAGQDPAHVKRLILTASGGPFLDLPAASLAAITPDQALAHPKWRMGSKISVDSATLMNKGLEAIEARWLFGLSWDKIHIHVHPQSIVHSMVEFVDGSVLAQLGRPDMRVPIAYALSYPERLPLGLPGLDLPRAEPLTFAEPDEERFPCLALALTAGRRGGTGPAALSAANEVAVASFLAGELAFPDIAAVVAEVLAANGAEPLAGLEQAVAADSAARLKAGEIIERIKGDRGQC